MPKRENGPIMFEAALPQRTAFTLDGEGEATLKLIVPEQFAKVLSEHSSPAELLVRRENRRAGGLI